MNLKTIVIFVFLFPVSIKSLAGDIDPIRNFCVKNGIHKKSIIIALSIGNCAVCYVPPDELLDKIRDINMDIPVYVVSDEDMAEGEKKIFGGKFGQYANGLVFVSDKSTYRYMLAQKEGVPSVCCVSGSGEVLVFKHLKHESLDDFFKIIKPNFEFYLLNKIELKSSFISPKRHNGSFHLKDGIYLFHWGANVIAKYNMKGENVKNLSIDSIQIDYLWLAQQIFPKKLYESSEFDYKTNYPKRNRLLRPINVIEVGRDSLAVLMEVTACGDTILNNKSVKYNRSFACLFLFDGNLNYLGAKFFSPYGEASIVNVYMRGAYTASNFFLGRYDSLARESMIAQYEVKKSSLFLKRVFVAPRRREERSAIPMIPSISISANRIYVAYFKTDENGLISSVRAYKLDVDDGIFTEALVTNMYWAQMYSTKKENYLLWTIDKDYTSLVKGYDKNTRQLISSIGNSRLKAVTESSLFFVIDGYLHEYAYSE